MLRAFVAIVTALTILAAALGGASAGQAEEADPPPPPDIILPGENVNLEDFIWLKRPLVVFADSPADPRYIHQMEYISEGLADLAERDVVVLTDTDPKKRSALRETLRPRGFTLVLIGKDGIVYLRKPVPWSVREISRVIDKMPLRQQEIEERRAEG